MSHPSPADHGHAAGAEQDTVESIVPLMPLVLPLCGGVLMSVSYTHLTLPTTERV